MFDNVYDNGEIILGKVIWVKEYICKNTHNITEVKDLINDLEKLYINDIVAINYDQGMGYSIDYWTYNDIVNKPE